MSTKEKWQVYTGLCLLPIAVPAVICLSYAARRAEIKKAKLRSKDD